MPYLIWITSARWTSDVFTGKTFLKVITSVQIIFLESFFNRTHHVNQMFSGYSVVSQRILKFYSQIWLMLGKILSANAVSSVICIYYCGAKYVPMPHIRGIIKSNRSVREIGQMYEYRSSLKIWLSADTVLRPINRSIPNKSSLFLWRHTWIFRRRSSSSASHDPSEIFLMQIWCSRNI